jgi:hypothetical protein
MSSPEIITVQCDTCGERHEGSYSHEGRFGEGAIFEIVCPTDGLSDFYTRERAL